MSAASHAASAAATTTALRADGGEGSITLGAVHNLRATSPPTSRRCGGSQPFAIVVVGDPH